MECAWRSEYLGMYSGNSPLKDILSALPTVEFQKIDQHLWFVIAKEFLNGVWIF